MKNYLKLYYANNGEEIDISFNINERELAEKKAIEMSKAIHYTSDRGLVYFETEDEDTGEIVEKQRWETFEEMQEREGDLFGVKYMGYDDNIENGSNQYIVQVKEIKY